MGEFLQLQPVPNMFDKGCYMFESPLFNHVISHRFALTQVTSQSEEDQEFLKALLQNRDLPLLLEQRADTFIKEMCTAHFLL